MNLSNPTVNAPTLWSNPWMVLAACLVGSFAVYGCCLGNLWYHDDIVFLAEAASIQNEPWVLLHNLVMGFFRPVFSGYIALLNAAFGFNPLGYYVVGIVLHALNAFAVWALARKIIGGAAGPAVAAGAFLTFFVHCEGVLWISSHNSAMLAGFSILAVLAHSRAVEKGTVVAALVTPFPVALTLFTKETGLTVLAWLVVAEWIYSGWRSCIRPMGLLRYLLIAAVVVLYFFSNPRLSEGFLGASQARVLDNRVSLAFVTPGKFLAAYGWLFSPFVTTQYTLNGSYGFLSIGWGAMAAAVPLIASHFWRREYFKPFLFAAFITATGLAGPCMFYSVSATSSRFYYYPTVGAALTVGTAAAWFFNASQPLLARKSVRGLTIGALLLVATFHAIQIRRLNDILYKPESMAQTGYLRSVKNTFVPRPTNDVILVDPAIPNSLHNEYAFGLLYQLPSSRVRMEFVPVAQFRQWLTRMTNPDDPKRPLVLQYTPERGLFTPTAVPELVPTRLETAYGLTDHWRAPTNVCLVHVYPDGK